MIKNLARWRNQLNQAKNSECKQFNILNFAQSMQTKIAIIQLYGPPGSPFQGYSFRIQYDGTRIPFKHPKVRFIDIPWSPYVCFKTGSICCDILNDQWSPALVIRTVILSILSLLDQKTINQNEPGLNIEASAQMRSKYSTYFAHARQQCEKQNNKKIIYADEQKPMNLIQKDKNIDDVAYIEEKDKFMNDPQIKKKHQSKIRSFRAKDKAKMLLQSKIRQFSPDDMQHPSNAKKKNIVKRYPSASLH